MDQPFDFVAAVAASREASEDQEKAEKALKERAREFAEAEREYRKALAQKILSLRAGGEAKTTAADIARGDANVADLKFHRDLAEGMKEAAAQSIWRHVANRRDMLQMIEWSKRSAFLDLEPVGR